VWYSPGHSPSRPREHPREPLWTLRRDDRKVACELRDHGEPVGAEVQLLRNGEFYAGRRFDTRDMALRHADHLRVSLEHDGWRIESAFDP
jgi:hypothetical protein